MSKKVYTTGEVAEMLGVNINTVIRWFDRGVLQGFKLPTSNERRIPISSLRRFMAQNMIPIDLMHDDTPQLRMHNRVQCSEPASLSVIQGNERYHYDATVLDISEGGVRISLTGSDGFTIPTVEYTLMLKIVDGPLSGVDAVCRIVHIKSVKAQLNISLQFADPIPQSNQRWQNFLRLKV
ncbi:MAG: helix-turn-helix domain-containing protein [Candidatus Alcyoniella australis]|nr:helix-turn-helix domain-containing protein [Candidatus Alcyoniella australis]